MNKESVKALPLGERLAEAVEQHVSKDALIEQLHENKDSALLAGEIQAGRIILAGICNFLRAVGGEATAKAMENPFVESGVKVVTANALRILGSVISEFVAHPTGKKAVIFLTRTPLRSVGVDVVDKVDIASVFKMFGGTNLVSLFQTWLDNQPDK